MDRQVTKQLLLSSNYWVLNKDMVKMLGLETAFLLSNFAEAETMMADEKGWFYQTVDTIEKMTTLSRHKQDQCIKQLEDKGILEKEVRGIPPKRYFKINYKCLTNQFVNFQQINMRNFNKSICKKSATNKESSYKESSYKESTVISGGLSKQDKNLVIEEWNKLNLQNLVSINSNTKRHTMLVARIKEYGLDNVIQAIQQINDSSFLKGQNSRNWTITFDWLVRPNNFIKVLEGNYNDEGGQGGEFTGRNKENIREDEIKKPDYSHIGFKGTGEIEEGDYF